MTPSKKHNELAREFVMNVASKTNSHSELMVVVESVLLAAMLLSRKLYNLPPHGCVEMVEMAVQQATDRFSGRDQ